MKPVKLILLLALLPAALFAQTNTFPDGKPVPAWFSESGKVDVSALGPQYVVTRYGVKRDSTRVQTGDDAVAGMITDFMRQNRLDTSCIQQNPGQSTVSMALLDEDIEALWGDSDPARVYRERVRQLTAEDWALLVPVAMRFSAAVCGSLQNYVEPDFHI